tara:strand:- start:291 stop:566 length:276 start_codon:yes stop_codon:yes gene_type:complete
MSSLITLLCIFGLSVFMYAYISMYNLNKDYPSKCNILYIPRSEGSSVYLYSNMEVFEHETHDNKFRHSRYDTAPRGITELDDLLSSNSNML